MFTVWVQQPEAHPEPCARQHCPDFFRFQPSVTTPGCLASLRFCGSWVLHVIWIPNCSACTCSFIPSNAARSVWACLVAKLAAILSMELVKTRFAWFVSTLSCWDGGVHEGVSMFAGFSCLFPGIAHAPSGDSDDVVSLRIEFQFVCQCIRARLDKYVLACFWFLAAWIH